jgi:threonine/homoserine/homoserine lactone efflux protein
METFTSTLALGILSGFIGSMGIAGPITVLVLGRMAQHRDAEGRALAMGAAIAEGVYAAIAGFGAKLLVGVHGPLAIGARVLAALLLAVAGIVLLRPAHPPHADPLPKPARRMHGFWLGFAVAALNPALIAGWTAAIAGLVSWDLMPGSHVAAVVFGFGVTGGVMAWFTLAIRGMRKVRTRIKPTTVMRVRHVAGWVLIVLAVALAAKIVAMSWQ